MNLTPEQQARVRAWLEKLRSGQYRQGTCALRHECDDGQSSYCCLGVAGELLAEAGLSAWGEPNSNDEIPLSDDSAMLTPSAQRLFGLDDVVAWHLAQLNDSDRLPFPQIADVIERVMLNGEDFSAAVQAVKALHAQSQPHPEPHDDGR